MAASVEPCTKCGNPAVKRRRSDIADKVREAIAIARREPIDWTRRFQTLTAHLLWLEAELRGECTNCVLQRASAAFAEASAEIQQSPPDLVREAKVIPLPRKRGSFYEQVAGQPLRPVDPDGAA